jgi:hypothetical protein
VDSDMFLGLSWCTLSWHGWHNGTVLVPPSEWGTT